MGHQQSALLDLSPPTPSAAQPSRHSPPPTSLPDHDAGPSDFDANVHAHILLKLLVDRSDGIPVWESEANRDALVYCTAVAPIWDRQTEDAAWDMVFAEMRRLDVLPHTHLPQGSELLTAAQARSWFKGLCQNYNTERVRLISEYKASHFDDALKAFRSTPQCWVRDSRAVVLAVLACDPPEACDPAELLENVSERLRADEMLVRAFVAKNWSAMQHAPAQLRSDRELALQCIAQEDGHAQEDRCTGHVLEYLSDALKDDQEVVLACLAKRLLDSRSSLFANASARLRDDEDTVRKAVALDPLALRHASARLRADLETLRACVESEHHRAPACALFAASEEMQDDALIVTYAVSRCGVALESASERLRNDYNVVRTAVACDGRALEWASERLRNNRVLARIAMELDGSALEYASKRLRDDSAIVQIAVTNDTNGLYCLATSALQWASERLRDDDQIVRTAVAVNSEALKYASARLRDDDAIVRAAVESCKAEWVAKGHLKPEALQYASKRLRNDPLLKQIANACDSPSSRRTTL